MAISPERWRLVETIFHGAVEQPPAQRSAWLVDACAGDAELLREVEILLAQHASAEGLLAKKKQGFSVDTVNLWHSLGYDLCDHYLDQSRSVSDGLVNPEWIRKHLRKDGMDVRYVNKFLGILALEVWYRLFVTKEMKPGEKLTA